MATLGKRKAVKSPSPSSSSEDEQDEEPVNGNDESASGSEELDSDISTDSGDEFNNTSDDDSDHSSQPSQEVVNVSFEYFDPKPDDFHGIKALLRMYLDAEVWDISGFTDLLLAQTTVGTVVKAAEDESPLGLLTALNLGRYQKTSCMMEIHKYLRVKSAHKAESALLEDFWGKQANETALLISERVINMPLELAPPLYQGLFEEVMWATEDEPTQELRDSFRIKNYLYLTKVYEELPKDNKGDKKVQLKKQTEEPEITGELIYIKPEDEILHQLSSWSFSFPVTGECMAAQKTEALQQLRLVMAVEAKHMDKFQIQLKNLVE